MKRIPLLMIGAFLFASCNFFQTSKSVKANAENKNANETGLITDNELIETFEYETAVRNLPTLIVDVESKDDLDKVVTTDTRPSNVILHFDENANIIDKEGNVIDSFINVYNEITPFIIPILSIQDENSMNAFMKFSKTQLDMLDMAVLSNTPSYVKTIRETNTKIRGIVEYSELSEEKNLYEMVVAPTNENLAQVAVLPSSLATKENVTYVHARFKTVWTRLDKETDFDIYSALQTGTYGLIVKDYEHIYELFEQLEEGTAFRPFFNVGHRGLPKQAHENSVSGTKKAMEVGATHVELDAYVTKDNKIYFMHDGTIDRTTSGTGSLENYTSEELEKFELDVYKPNEKIPNVDDIFQTLKDTQTILVLEVKTEKENFPTLLKEKLDQYQLYDQIVIISFSTTALERVKNNLPMIPTAYLGNVSEKTFDKNLALLGRLNAGIDSALNAFSKEFNELYLRDRGYIGWYWTIDNIYNMKHTCIKNGLIGITNNIADYFTNRIFEIKGNDMKLEKGQDFTKDLAVTLTATTYVGGTIEVEGQIFSYQEKERGKYSVIAAFKDESMELVYYTAPFEIQEYETSKPSKKNGCQKASTAVIATFSLLLFMGAILLKKNSLAN